MARKDDWMVSMDLQDGFYAIGIDPEFRDYFTVNYRGTLYRLAGLPMGWCNSPCVFHQFVAVMVKELRAPVPSEHRHPRRVARKRRRQSGEQGIRLLPFVDDFLFLSQGRQQCLQMRDHIDRQLDSLGLQRHPDKGVWEEPVQCIEHLGLEIDTRAMQFRAPSGKLRKLAGLAKDLLVRAARDRRWVPARLLAVLAGKAQFLYLAIPPARFYLRELHSGPDDQVLVGVTRPVIQATDSGTCNGGGTYHHSTTGGRFSASWRQCTCTAILRSTVGEQY